MKKRILWLFAALFTLVSCDIYPVEEAKRPDFECPAVNTTIAALKQL